MKFARIVLVGVCALRALSLEAQQNALLIPVPKMQFLDLNGYPLAGGLVYTCVAGSGCPGTTQETYTSSSALIKNSNPIVLDSSGSANIWLTPGIAYKIVVENSAGALISSTDNVSAYGSLVDHGNADPLAKSTMGPIG